MLSIFIMYSKDRFKPLEMTVSCLKDMKGYDKCQKTLVVDSDPGTQIPEGFDIIRVPRIDNKFCWASMWDAGVATAQNDKVLYLDSDRLLPKTYLEQVADAIKDDCFVFTSHHFMVLKEAPLEECKEALTKNSDDIILDNTTRMILKFEPRFKDPVNGPGKNVMSGSTGFTRKTYYRVGCVDPWYHGHGAFADTDFHAQAAHYGCTFHDLKLTELHYHHHKLDQNKIELDFLTLQRMGLDNYIYYCLKWQVPLAMAENYAMKCRILNPVKYVSSKSKEILEKLKSSPRDLVK